MERAKWIFAGGVLLVALAGVDACARGILSLGWHAWQDHLQVDQWRAEILQRQQATKPPQ